MAANTGTARDTVIGVAGVAAHTVSQAAPAECSYTIDPPAASFPAEGGDGSFDVQTDAGCAWTATSDKDWVTVTAGSGTGPGTVQYTVAGNSGDERYANVAGVSAPMKGLTIPQPRGPVQLFDLDAPNWDTFDQFSERLQEQIKKAPEYDEARFGAPGDDVAF